MKPVVVIPTLNEAKCILTVLKELSAPLRNGEIPQIWVVDGFSCDGTADLVREWPMDHVLVIDNPGRTQAHAVNLAAARARSCGGIDVLVRIDAHASYPDDYVQRLLDTLAETKADSVVVPLKTVGGGPMRDAAAVLFGSWLGNGGAPHRSGLQRGFVEHGHHAAFLLKSFLFVGGYDTAFRANEDAELDYRLISAGSSIFLEPNLTVDYLPRESLVGTFRQYLRNGRGRMQRARKHGVGLGLRQLIPSLLLPVLAAAALLGIILESFMLLIPTAYFSGIFLGAVVLAYRAGQLGLLWRIAGLASAAHFGFSFGATKEWIRGALDPGYRNWWSHDEDRLIPTQAR